ncbi:hypothetical protein SISNIDRAFT_459741 [Sistotremastrum niveocremeum HHB9708]|uniref:Uncharacterized protein n=2 Tax=Sistotremastraceae TaxID=3402574 RepID=A0A164P9U6_9AGAM|nr:hypothetical protein SISNIDRAFT_459741 [Sistotremastrum niveocremeum HHB9708]KZT32733.1 hypothetical protein SISSUDRAFT_1055170 [Sistotremastrum suecicum HHB10207 ss-3]
MNDHKHDIEHHDDTGLRRQMTTITLSNEQFESLYLQPRDPRMDSSNSRRFGNPTPLGVSSFLLAHVPLAMDLLNFQGATAASTTTILGAFYACAGAGLYLACIMEWILGNTFPSVVFGTFGGFWISYGVIIQPSAALAASFAPASDASNGITAAAAGAATREYNAGLGMYFVVWGILCVFYFIASLRTNVPFAIVFFCLIFAFEFIAAAYFHTGQGRTSLAAAEFKIGGGFAFGTGLAGFWIDLHLLLASVGFRWNVPIFDLSGYNLLREREKAEMGKDV